MNSNIELLNYIHQNSQMGRIAVEQTYREVEDENFKQLLQSQINEYEKIYDKAEEKIQKEGGKAKENSPIRKIQSYIMINLNTINDKSPSHIAQLIIRGATMGVIDITKRIKEYREVDEEILELANDLLKFEQRNIEELKKFL
ncbi:MAG: hypothetical protein Q8936_15130 [Bacillota bacterium]|nr:hypothetical protein [Bacillota bacterium]